MITDVLTANGIQRAQLVVEAAQAAGLELGAACVVLVAESSGGANVWGHDPTTSIPAALRGQPVTKADYLAYKALRGTHGAQGVGPCQISFGPLQDQADALGGCWDPGCNLRVGFQDLQGMIARYGLHDGFLHYNGSGEAAARYADAAMAALGVWRARLAPVTAATAAAPPALQQGDAGPAVARLQAWLNQTYPLYSKIDLAPQRYGPQTVAVIKEFQRRSQITDGDGRNVGPRTWAALLAAGYRP